MPMDTYIVRFSVNGKPAGAITVEAPNSSAARQIALGEIGGMTGYEGKRISINSVSKVR